MKLQMVGCSHHNSSVAVRERLAFTPGQTAEALAQIRRRFPGSEAVLLSTCNRTEIYTATEEDIGPSHQEVAEFLAHFHGLELYEVFDELFERTGEDAVRHLFTVAASLDSMVVGEPQILAQVKQAYRMATETNAAGPLTHSIFQAAVRVARRVATETTINQRRVSIPSVAVADFGKEIFETFSDKRILVIGAGEMGQETLRYLRDEGACDIVVINRNAQRALEVAGQWNGRAATWDRLVTELIDSDMVISTTGATEPIVSRQQFEQVEAARYQRPLFILDLAIPRDFDAAIANCLGVFLYSIDDLSEVCHRNQQHREKELPVAVRIIEQETDRFMAELHHRTTGPIIKRLKQGWQRSKEDELRRLFNKLPELEDRQRDEIEIAFDRLMNKLLHPPLESLRDEARHGSPQTLLEALKRLFQIGE